MTFGYLVPRRKPTSFAQSSGAPIPYLALGAIRRAFLRLETEYMMTSESLAVRRWPDGWPDELWSPKKTSETTGISMRTLRRWGAEGEITVYRFGERLIRYNPQEIFGKLCTTNRDWEV